MARERLKILHFFKRRERPTSEAETDDSGGGIFIELTPEEIEEQYRTGARDRNVDEYFALLEKIEAAIKARNYSEAIAASKASLPLLSSVIADDQRISSRGKRAISSIPAIDEVGKVMAALGDVDSLRAVALELQKHPELGLWQELMVKMIEDAQLGEEIITLVGGSPGFLQRKLKDVLHADAMRLRDLCYWMEKVGRLRREKSGNSYELFVPSNA